MPNFGAVGSALAKETNWEPEEEPETEDESECCGFGGGKWADSMQNEIASFSSANRPLLVCRMLFEVDLPV
jgi:hypothetical protein